MKRKSLSMIFVIGAETKKLENEEKINFAVIFSLQLLLPVHFVV